MPADTAWFTNDRFGMFIHWGLYSMAARHEWLMHNEKIPVPDYEKKYFRRFDPDLYDPEVWADEALNAGMKYAVLTTKHHEGFCLWDSQYTDYKSTNTPAKRDLLKPFVSALESRNMGVGFYHSLIDWHHPDFILDPVFGPYRDHPQRDAMNQGRDQSRYAQYLYNQIKELLTSYPSVKLLWCDFSYPRADGQGKGRKDWNSEALIKMIRDVAPRLMINNRLDLPDVFDFVTPEQFQPRREILIEGKKVVWEACQTFSGSWGYHRDENDWRTVDNLVQTLIDCVSKDGNLLLNVGPTGRGEFDPRALDRLRGIGSWMKKHSRSIYGCGQAPAEFIAPQDSRLTYNPKTNRLYVHLFAWPYKHLHLDGAFKERVEYAQLLHDGSEVALKGLENWQIGHAGGGETVTALSVTLPQNRPDVIVPVVELFLKS